MIDLAAPPSALDKARRYTLQALADGWFPGAQILVAHGEKVLWHEVFGHAAVEPSAARMEPATLIDIASLTKALVTSTVAAVLVGEGLVELDAPLVKYLPKAAGTDKANLTIRQLLSHAGGFPLYVPYFREIVPGYSDYREMPFEALRREIIGRVLAEKLVAPPGTTQQYSDFDFILLGEALGKAAGARLDEVFHKYIAAPLRLSACYRPLPLAPEPGSKFAATELCPWRGEVLQGQVHDDHAYLMGGVAGHAGLFAHAADVWILVRELMRAYYGERSLFKTEVVREFWTRASSDPKLTWTLGWDTPTPGESTSGKYFAPNTVGHLGFTGASMWIDLDRRYTVLVLTNRIHPLRSNLGIKQFRPIFHDLVMEGLLGIAPASR